MIKLVLLSLVVLILACLCCAGLSFFLIDNRVIINPSETPDELDQPTETIAPISPIVSETNSPTGQPELSPTSSPSSTPIPSETGTNNSAFLPYQSSTSQEAAACINDLAKRQAATVSRVIDGDTIDVLIDGAVQRVRYIGIDSPEMDFPLGDQARAENMKLVDGQEVVLIQDVSDIDQYNRLLRYVVVKDVLVNFEMVQSGFAMSKGYPPDTACQKFFDQAETEAKAAGLGMWAATPTPIPGAASADASTNAIVIQNIFFDGLVKRVESDEYAEIINTSAVAVDLTGWRLNAGNPGQDFVFPGYLIEPGVSCRVYTNETHAESGGLSFASPNSIWNNQGDCGYLYDPVGALVDDYCY